MLDQSDQVVSPVVAQRAVSDQGMVGDQQEVIDRVGYANLEGYSWECGTLELGRFGPIPNGALGTVRQPVE